MVSGTLSVFVSRYITAKKVEGCSPKTITWYEYILGRLKGWLQKDEELSSFSPTILRNYFTYLEPSLSKVSLKSHWTGLKAFFRWCYEEKLIDEDPMRSIKKIKVPQLPPKCISEEEVDKLLKACNLSTFIGIRNYAMISTFVETAIRLSEFCNLMPEDLDLQRRTLLVRNGKGGKSRLVFFCDRTYQALQKWLKVRHSSLNSPVFCTREGKKLDSRNINWILFRLARKAGLESKVSPHRLRHTGATILAKGGMNAFQLAQLLGHNDVKTTMIYTHLGGSSLQIAHAKISPIERIYSKAY